MTRLVTFIRSGTVGQKDAFDRAAQASQAERGWEKAETQSPMEYCEKSITLYSSSNYMLMATFHQI